MGVWIEILYDTFLLYDDDVTPLVGVWIEINDSSFVIGLSFKSLPLWECGLKYLLPLLSVIDISHSPCGSVD